MLLDAVRAGTPRRIRRSADALVRMRAAYTPPRARGYARLWHPGPQRALHLSRSQAATSAALDRGVTPAVERDHTVLHDILNQRDVAPMARGSADATGLFGIASLTEPRAFPALAEKALIRAQLLVDRISAAGTMPDGAEELAKVVHNLDRLSDVLCGVIDLAELVRHAHPEREWADAANAAYEYLCNYMNVLNTHTGLFHALSRSMRDEQSWKALSEEGRAVALIFLRDFERSGIHLPPQERARFVELSDEILSVGRTFLQEISMGESDMVTAFPVQLLRGMDANALMHLRAHAGPLGETIPVAPGSWELHFIAKYAPDPRARRLAYHISNTGRNAPVEVLDRLLRARYDLAVLTGKGSFAEMTLVDKMAGTPDAVRHFLQQIAAAERPATSEVLGQLRTLKQKREGHPDIAREPLQVWDREFYSEEYMQAQRTEYLMPLSPYLSLGSVFTGLSRLFYLLYGIHFRAAPMRSGEVWSADVVKLDVVDESEAAVIGTVYCDLYARPGKPPSAAHYTVRCSRRIDNDDVENDIRFGWTDALPRDIDLGDILDVNAAALRGRPGLFQQPMVVLMTDFSRPQGGGVSLLRWHEVETLFHEMGHAIHSMIGRTEFQNVSGTRCATDFVELPSILMEHFLTDPGVVALTAHHYQTGAPLPYEQLQAHLQGQKHMDAVDAQQQILLAAVDQSLHSVAAGRAGFASANEVAAAQTTMGVFPPVNGATWQGQFGHLFGYGATYYSYLFDRAIAARVWRRLFASQPLARAAGERFKTEILAHGGGKNPWAMLAAVLDDPQLAAGDEHAMEIVGSWGLGERV
ncbi:mitochondrial intermediate peptidase [Malassezia sp. CBS 17886]|nr:mitochondrial intermediate peptidase [Malassezia sp. CBS 17886]